MNSVPPHNFQKAPFSLNRPSLISHPTTRSQPPEFPNQYEASEDPFAYLRLDNKDNSEQGLKWAHFDRRNTNMQKPNTLPYRLDRPDLSRYQEEMIIEKEISSTKSMPEPSLFTRTLMNLRNNKKSYSNQEEIFSTEPEKQASMKAPSRNSSFARQKKNDVLGLHETTSNNSERELLSALGDKGNHGRSILRKSSAKTAPFFSTPRMLWKESGEFDVQRSGTRATKTTGNITSTIMKTPRNIVQQEYIVTVTENRAKEIGIAAFNVVTGEIIISQISDNHTYVNALALLFRFYPIETIFPQTQENSLLFLNVQKRFKNVTIKMIKKIFFDESKGCLIYSQTATNHISDLDSKYLGFAALNALYSYLEFVRGTVLVYSSLKISFHYNEHFMLIDLATIEILELLLNNKTKTSIDSLISCFECQTVGGSRLLRASVLQPLNNQSKIEERYDAVDELLSKPELLGDLKKILKTFHQCDNVAAKFIQKFNENDNRAAKVLYINIVMLYQMLNGLDVLIDILDYFKSPLFINCRKVLSDKIIAEITSNIESKLHVDPKSHGNEKYKQKIFYLVKNESNEYLDLARIYYARLTSEIYQVHQKYQQALQTKDLHLQNQDNRGFCLFVNHNLLNKYSLEEIESIIQDPFVQITKRGKGCLVKTRVIESLNNRIKESCNEILNQTQKTLRVLLDGIRSRITIVFNISEAIAQIDMMLTFANYKLNSPHVSCRPHFNNQLSTLAINNSRHPVLEKNKFVPNNYFFTPHNPLTIVFGKPGSGKTVYIKQIALICILAQIGCPIPCESATLLIYDRLFARIGSNDNLELNESSLYFELNQSYNIFQNVVGKSDQIKFRTLVISDGFAKSTNSEESFAITFAFIEQFLLFNNVNLLLTANDAEILSIAEIYRFINCIQMKSDIENRRIKHRYKAEKIDFETFSYDLMREIEVIHMPKDFRKDFEEALRDLVNERPVISRAKRLEEKYLEKVNEFLMIYSQIIMKQQTQEEKTAELLQLKKTYFKDIVGAK